MQVLVHQSSSSMPAVRTPKKGAAAQQGSVQESPKRSPVKNPGIQKRRNEWRSTLKPWVVDWSFKHKQGISTYGSTEAKQQFQLDEYDLKTLPYEKRPNPKDPTFNPTKLYAFTDLEKLTLDKAKALQLTEVKIAGLIVDVKTYTESGGTVFIGRPAKLPKLEAWQEHDHNHKPPAKVIKEYHPPKSPVQPDPPEIAWTPSYLTGPVDVADACRLYCLESDDIKDLAKVSKWIDLGTAARRALELHGGYYAHMDLVKKRRDAEIRQLDSIKSHYTDDFKSVFRFSEIVHQEWVQDRSDDWMYDTSTSKEVFRVAVHYPVHKETDDYGCSPKYVPAWGDF